MIPDNYRRWYLGLSARERVLVAALGLVAAVLLFWLAVVMPLADFRGTARADYAAALEDRAEADALLSRLGAGAVGGSGAAPADEVRAVFAQAGLQPAISADGGGLSVKIAAVRADILFNLIGRLEGETGLTVARAAVRANDDATLAAEMDLTGGQS